MPVRPLRAVDMPCEAELGLDFPVDFAEFYRLYGPRLRRWVQRVYPRADHDAAVQDTLARAHRHYDAVCGLADPWPWLVTVLTNVVRNQARGRKTHLVALEDAGHLADHAPQPDAQIVSLERVRALGQAIESLPASQRDLVRLMISEGLTAAEAGDVLGMQPATARQQLHRLRGRLRAELAKHGGLAALVPSLPMLARALHRSARRTAVAPTVGMAALAGVIGVTAVITGPGAAQFDFGRGAAQTVSQQTVAPIGHPAIEQRPAAPSARLRSATVPHQAASAPTATAPQGPDLATVSPRLSSHPMRSGQHSGARIVVHTPAGDVGLDGDLTQKGDAQACPLLQPVC